MPNKNTSYKRHSEEEVMLQKLYKTVGALIATIAILFITLRFFGPKVGSFFLLVSKNRNDNGPGDIIPPSSPIFSDTNEATNEKEITLNGITEAGATVKLFVNGPEKGKTTSDNDGVFTFIDIKLSTGKNIIFAKAIDENGNESEKSELLEIVFDEEEPEIKITEPTNGEEVKNLDKRVMIRGTVNEEANVKVNGRQAIMGSENSFELLLGIEEGDIQIEVEATDKAGNTKIETIYIKYKKSS